MVCLIVLVVAWRDKFCSTVSTGEVGWEREEFPFPSVIFVIRKGRECAIFTRPGQARLGQLIIFSVYYYPDVGAGGAGGAGGAILFLSASQVSYYEQLVLLPTCNLQPTYRSVRSVSGWLSDCHQGWKDVTRTLHSAARWLPCSSGSNWHQVLLHLQ